MTHPFLFILLHAHVILCVGFYSYLYPCFLSSLLLIAAATSQFQHRFLSHPIRDEMPNRHALKLCASAPVRLGVCTYASRSSVGPNLYIIPSDDASERQTGSGWPSGVSLLNEISAPLTRALLFSPFARRTGMTFDSGICEQPPSSSK